MINPQDYVLGCFLLMPDSITRVRQVLKPAHFTGSNIEICRTVFDLYDNGKSVDLLTVQREMAKAGTLESSGGISYLVDLTAKVGSDSHIETHSKGIIEKFTEREAITQAERLIRAIKIKENNVFQVLEKSCDRLSELSLPPSAGMNQHTTSSLMEKVLKLADNHISERIKAEKSGEIYVPGILTGIPFFDYGGIDNPQDICIGKGLEPYHLIFMLALPKHGKTAMVEQWAISAAEQGYPVIFFCLDTSQVDVAARMACRVSRVPLKTFKAGRMTEQQLYDFNVACGHIETLNIKFIEDGVKDARDIVNITKDWRRKNKKHLPENPKANGVVFVDHLGMVGSKNDLETFTDTAKRMKQLAMSERMPVVVLAHAGAHILDRKNKMPHMGDCYGAKTVVSGLVDVGYTLEIGYKHIDINPNYIQDAYANSMNKADQDFGPNGWGCVKVAVNRHGGTGYKCIGWKGDILRWSEDKVFSNQYF